MPRSLFLLAIMLFGVCAPLSAEPSPPIPKSKATVLNLFKKQLDEENKEKKNLQLRVKEIHDDLSNTKNKLIPLAASIHQNELDLKKSEQKISNLELKKSILEDELHADRKSIAKLVLALERIRRTPPEAMLARPETPYKTAQSAMLMGSIIPSVNRHAEKLNKNLGTLSRVTKELELDKAALLKTSKDLKSRHRELFSLLSKRKKLYAQTNNNIHAREVSIQKISMQAKSLKDLVQRIKEDGRKEAQRQKMANIKKKANIVRKITDDGKARLPASGIIRISYKQKDTLGAKSKGITIEGRKGGLIVAPMSGKVQFTGTFKRYGNIVIIEHANNYHSLVAGLDEINTLVGDYIKSGEPIGILPNSSLIPRPKLYYELRKNGIPVNPAIKFPDLG